MKKRIGIILACVISLVILAALSFVGGAKQLSRWDAYDAKQMGRKQEFWHALSEVAIASEVKRPTVAALRDKLGPPDEEYEVDGDRALKYIATEPFGDCDIAIVTYRDSKVIRILFSQNKYKR
jgi:hypothetical protein